MTAYTEPSYNNPDLAQFVDAILARQRDLRNEGIDEREINRVLVAEFSSGQNYVNDWAPTNNDPTYPALTDGQATTKYPPGVLPQELDIAGPFDNDGFDHKNPDPGYAGGRDVYNLDQYKTNAPENKVIKSSSLVNDPVLGALTSKVDSQPPTLGTTGYNSDMAIPPWRYDIEDDQLDETVTTDTSLPELLDKQREEYLQKDNDGIVDMPHAVVEGPEIPDEPHMVVEVVDPVWGKYHLGPAHPRSDICDKYKMKVYDLNDESSRPIPPSEGLGFTNTHPNCQCYWEIIKKPKKTSKVTEPQLKHIQHINRIIGQKSRYGSLHKVHADGSIYKTMTTKNPLHETIMEIREEFSWLTPTYLERIKAVNAPGKMYLIRASAEAITDHRGEGEALRRWLSPDELHGMARTATGKTMDVNHRPELQTEAQVLDSEFNKERNEIQMIINEQDPEINDAIERGDITAVSINGGSPRNENVICPDCDGPSCECFIVPEGVILGELDGIALTWVVTNPNGIMYKGQNIAPANPGVKTTAIEIL
ncbi:hypothetical protein IIB34_01455 [PVC group bacterium]|nr:hypothetical protein [PVC group bacterium]